MYIDSRGETYYFSSSQGNDQFSKTQAQSKNSPWNSIEKLNLIIPLLKPKDIILFKCGDIFIGHIQLKNLPPFVQFGAYGSGDKPIITSLESNLNWENLGGNIFKVNLENNLEELHVVLSGNELLEMGRYPNTNTKNSGYLVIEKVDDGEIKQASQKSGKDFTGAEIVIRKNNWIIDRHPLIWHLEDTYTFTDSQSSYLPIEGFGFFIQNHIETLDREGEWYYDKREKQLYLYSEKPLDAISVVSEKNLLSINNCQNLKFSDIHFKGSNEALASIENSKNITLQNCIFSESGIYGVYAFSTDSLKIDNSEFTNHLNGGVFLRWNDKNTSITNCSFFNTFPYAGMGQNGDMQGQAIYMSEHSEAGFIDSNNFKNSGYIAINFNGSNTSVTNNIIDTFCYVKDDGAAIYTVAGKKTPVYTNRIVANNKIYNGIGARDGTMPFSKDDFPYVEGIYIDDNSRNVEVKNNTLSRIKGSGIFIHNAQKIVIQGNSIYKTSYGIKMANDRLGINIKDISVSENLIINEFEFQKLYNLRSQKEDIDTFGKFENNVYLNASIVSKPFEINYQNTNNTYIHEELPLEIWNNKYGFDFYSTLHTISNKYLNRNFIRIIENDTSETLEIPLQKSEKILNRNVIVDDKLIPNQTVYILNTNSLN